MSKLTDTDSSSSKTHYVERRIVGHGGELLLRIPVLSVESTSVPSVTKESSQPNTMLITDSPLLGSNEGLLPGESISSTCYQKQTDGKSYAQNVTMLKQGERMSEGKKFDDQKPPMELLSTIALVEAAKVMGKGKEKYGAQNWRSGLHWSRVVGAAYRHLSAFNAGEDKDPETGLSHIAHLLCCAMFLLEYSVTHPDLDDRYKPNHIKLAEKFMKENKELMEDLADPRETYL